MRANTTKPGKTAAGRILNCLPSPQQDQDWGETTATSAGVLGPAEAIPSSLDLREPWWAIGDQGFTGSCVGWASADSVLRWHLVKAGRIPQSTRLSPRFQWMASKEIDEFRYWPTSFIESSGTSLKASLKVARRWGALRERDLEFDGDLFPGSEDELYAIASRFRIASFYNLGIDLRAWRRWLASNGPILVRIEVDETFDNASATGGVLETFKPETMRGGHAIALVGYTSRRFIVRNSWGTGWGDSGFAYATNKYARQGFTEAYGVALA